jgi:hypothetical protein
MGAAAFGDVIGNSIVEIIQHSNSQDRLKDALDKAGVKYDFDEQGDLRIDQRVSFGYARQLRYSDVASEMPRIDSIDKKHSELPFTVQISLPELQNSSKDVVRREIERLVCYALLEIAAMYHWPKSGLEKFAEREFSQSG